MSKQPAIIVDNVSMKFNLSKEKVDSLKDYIIKSIKKEIKYNEFWALQNVSFTVEKGDRVGILGLNGAGKSTLLKVIAGVFKPTEGSVTKHGKMVPLLELGAGFDQQYTGKENIYLYGAMLGYSKEFIDEKYDEIVKFSELKDFIDVPIKNYSSGMKSRLGFSIATVVSPKILILDEVLSVGDAKFRKKSEKKVLSMFDSGVTVLFVSHSLAQVQRICNKAMILEKGKLIVREMTDLLVLDLVEKHLVTDQMVLTIGYDIDNLSDPARRSAYHGEVTTDRYGRKVPKHGHGIIHLADFTSSSAEIIEAAMTLYDRITSPALLIRRLNLSADHVIPEDQVKKEETYEQLSLFSDPSKEEAEKIQKEASRERERRLQTAMLVIKDRYGKNAILRGTDLEDGATTMERNNQIGGHKA